MEDPAAVFSPDFTDEDSPPLVKSTLGASSSFEHDISSEIHRGFAESTVKSNQSTESPDVASDPTGCRRDLRECGSAQLYSRRCTEHS